MFKFKDLPYSKNALEPVLSQHAVDVHYEKHERKYYDNLKKMIVGTNMEDMSVEKIITTTKSPYIFNNAAQLYNHDFFWQSLTPVAEQAPPSETFMELITQAFETMDACQESFTTKASKQFGSGWIWLVESNKEIEFWTTHDAGTPLTSEGVTPLLCVDLWEHAWYINYEADKKAYLEKIFPILNWEFAEKNLPKQ